MSLLEFARGPALQAGLAIFAFGVAWRLLSVLLLPRPRDLSTPRPGMPSAAMAALGEIVRRLRPPGILARNSLFAMLNGYVFHLGLAIVVLGLAQHILFVRGLLGLSWPALPTGVVNVAAVVTVASMVAALMRRFASPVLRLISTADDYLSWLVTFLPVVTGLAAVGHAFEPYETLLAIHILSVALLLAWFPFGKLMHAFLVFVSRGQTGVTYGRRGARI